MATPIPSFRNAKRFGHANTRHPWGRWLDCKAHRLTKGVDFTCSAHGLRSMLYDEASTRGLKVATKILDGGAAIDVEAYKP